MPASCNTRSTVSASRRASPWMVSPYLRTRCGSPTTPSARLPAAAPITDTGVRSSCDTAATNSICCRASACARRADTTIRPTASVSSINTLELIIRLRARTCATAASSDPERCFAISTQRPSRAELPGARDDAAVDALLRPVRPSTRRPWSPPCARRQCAASCPAAAAAVAVAAE